VTGRNRFEDIDVNEGVILNCTLKELWWSVEIIAAALGNVMKLRV
jgi:hypothetical protein